MSSLNRSSSRKLKGLAILQNTIKKLNALVTGGFWQTKLLHFLRKGGIFALSSLIFILQTQFRGVKAVVVFSIKRLIKDLALYHMHTFYGSSIERTPGLHWGRDKHWKVVNVMWSSQEYIQPASNLGGRLVRKCCKIKLALCKLKVKATRACRNVMAKNRNSPATSI